MKEICQVCSNKDKNYFFYLNGKLCCRKCLNYKGLSADKNHIINKGEYTLKYELTNEQKKASDFIVENVKNGKNCAINAVCGAGKTEIIYELLKYCLNNNKKVGITIPRKDVVIELKERISKDFNVDVVAVYGGNNKVLEGDIIIFTTHQSFRYINYFDVLIIDEVDAFPYNDNKTLKEIIHKCSILFVYLSATMPLYIENDRNIEKYYLNKRYHGHDLPLPRCITCINMIFTLKRLLRKYKDKVVLVYFPTIKCEKKSSKKIKCDYMVNSKINSREEILSKIKSMKKGIVFTTTILERGITIKDVQVIVYNADNPLFNKDTLIQISGRVGRDKNYHQGDIMFICKRKNKEIKETIKKIKECNE